MGKSCRGGQILTGWVEQPTGANDLHNAMDRHPTFAGINEFHRFLLRECPMTFDLREGDNASGNDKYNLWRMGVSAFADFRGPNRALMVFGGLTRPMAPKAEEATE